MDGMKTEVRDAFEHHRYEILADGDLAGFAVYRDMDGTRVFTHTEVFPAFEDRGLGTILIGGALDDARAAGRSIVALCPFVDRFVGKHPEYGDLVDSDLDVKLRQR
jgi:predicted GNAT family acetyltransferase